VVTCAVYFVLGSAGTIVIQAKWKRDSSIVFKWYFTY